MTLIEVMAASVVLIVAVLGVFGAQFTAANRISTGSRDTEAAAMAQDLAHFLNSIPYQALTTGGAALLSNANSSNDTDITDSAGAMDVATANVPSMVDHVESEIPATMAVSLTPINATNPNNTQAIYQRYWNVSPIVDPVTGQNNAGVTISAIVRYQIAGTYRHVAVVSTRFDPTLLRQ